MSGTRPRWSSQTKLTVALLLLGLALYLLYRFSAVLKPLILAIVLSYILSPLANSFQQRLKLRRGLATLLAYLVMLVVVATIPLVVLPTLASQVTNLNIDIQRFLSEVEKILGNQYQVVGQTIDMTQILQQIEGSVRGLLEPIFSQTLAFAIEAISSLVWLVFIAVVSFYLVKDAQALHQWFDDVIPPVYQQDFEHIRSEINQIWSAFFRGQLVLATVVATGFTIAGLAIGLPFALAMGVLAGLLEFLPSIGHGIWLSIASLLALFAGSTWIPVPNWVFMLILIGMHLFFQQFDLNYLIPRIIGRRVHLPPLMVILGIVSGAVLAGVMGILLAAPTIASARVLGRYIYANLFDQDPFPGAVAFPLPPPNPLWWRRAFTEKTPEVDDLQHEQEP
ncbi:MAG: AI-2E family transporter [Chloroflexota bacterium]